MISRTSRSSRARRYRTYRKSARKTSRKSSKKVPKTPKQLSNTKYCKKLLQSYVKREMSAWKHEGRWKSQKQAYAVARSMFEREHPRCFEK